ncbi:long-chain fatty acid--CoA ligase [Aquincola sp. S2]|uniref:Long-chain fatty acid--CoA ligase n=1 Tax=Pseudaquabacterium terrae TaxID=2732868 RepID=A0ABX2EA48_9BURK|nr:long-chain fatty acid--CoA ligase [Aquabacterium terrae]NRF65931.1 long-chain fatty acid--CoA ligase [Aquabacterium terrae]
MTDKPWLKSYPQGVRWDLDIEPMPLQRVLDASVARWPEQPALQFMGRRISYRELGELTDRAAKGLQQLGVKPGVHVGLFLPNTPHGVIAFFGILKAGGTVVNYSPLDAAKVLEHKIEDSETDLLFTLDLAVLYPQMAGMLGKTRLQRLIVGKLGEMTPMPDAVNAQMKAGQQLADVAWDDRHVRMAQLLDNDGQFTRYPVADPAQAIAVLQYTGGTTGQPKGAMLTHANLSAAAAQYVESTRDMHEVGVERFLCVLPPFHIYALTVNMLFGLSIGAELVLHARFDPKAALEDISARKITVFCGVPTMFTAVMDHPEVTKHDLRSLKFCASGGAPLPVEVGQRYAELTGCHLSEGWGMTETSPTGTFTPPTTAIKPGSCGIPLPRIEIKLLSLEDPTRYVPLGEKGEMCIKGPNVMKGYWKKPEATAEITTFDGFLRTGDVATMDGDGYVFIIDRCKDMLLCSGYNVYPRVLEEAIYLHPAASEVCVIGIPDAYRGQSPKAFVVLKPGALPCTLEQLQAFLKDKLGKHEMIQALEIRAALPKTAVGKLSKKDLVEEEARKRESAGALGEGAAA